MLIFQGFLYAIIGYIIGGILFSLIIGKVFLKVDIRVQGSGNAGATNLGRIAGAKRGGTFAIIGGTLDLAKGFIAIFINALLFRYAFNNDGNEFASWIIYLPIITSTAGHCAPITYIFYLLKTHSFLVARSKGGGKGVSTFGGSFFAISPIIAVCLFLIWLIIKKTTRITSVASIIIALISPYFILIPIPLLGYLTNNEAIGATGNVPGIANFFNANNLYIWVIIIMTIIAGLYVIVRHYSNIVRLIKGTENKSVKKSKVPAGK